MSACQKFTLLKPIVCLIDFLFILFEYLVKNKIPIFSYFDYFMSNNLKLDLINRYVMPYFNISAIVFIQLVDLD
jgi:hypothetical protein